MKKRWFSVLAAALLLLSLAACKGNGNNDQGGVDDNKNPSTEQNGGDKDGATENGGNGSAAKVTKYSENDVEFEIPESWQNNFQADFQEHNQDSKQYFTTIDFYYTTSGEPLKIMTIGRFSKEAWDALTAQGQGAEEKKLGESKDGAWIYTLNFEEYDYSSDSQYKQVKSDAKNLKDKIKITR